MLFQWPRIHNIITYKNRKKKRVTILKPTSNRRRFWGPNIMFLFSFDVVTDPPPTNSLNITIIVIIIILAVVLLAIIIFVILAIVAKRAHSKRDRDSVRRPQRASQSRMESSDDADAAGQNHRHYRQATDGQQPHENQRQVHGDAPTFTRDGEYLDGVNQGEAPHMIMLRTAPPPYSTFPRPMEQSLQIAEGTTPSSRSYGGEHLWRFRTLNRTVCILTGFYLYLHEVCQLCTNLVHSIVLQEQWIWVIHVGNRLLTLINDDRTRSSKLFQKYLGNTMKSQLKEQCRNVVLWFWVLLECTNEIRFIHVMTTFL